jgi:hypothetical protein
MAKGKQIKTPMTHLTPVRMAVIKEKITTIES